MGYTMKLRLPDGDTLDLDSATMWAEDVGLGRVGKWSSKPFVATFTVTNAGDLNDYFHQLWLEQTAKEPALTVKSYELDPWIPSIRPSPPETLQSALSKWSGRVFGSSPASVLVARANREMADILTHVVVGDLERVKQSVGDVGFVLMRIAETQGFDFIEAIEAQFEVNKNSEWKVDPWGRGTKVGDGCVPNTGEAGDDALGIANAVNIRELTPAQGVRFLRMMGASQKNASHYLIAFGGCREDDFIPDSPVARTKCDRNVSREAEGIRPTGIV